MRITKTVLILPSLLLAVFFLSLYASPYWHLWLIKKAVADKNNITLSHYINFPSLRKSIKASFEKKAAADAIRNKKEYPLQARLGLITPTPILNSVIDFLVTPSGLAGMMRGEKPELDEEGHLKKSTTDSDKKPIISMGYHDFDRFVMTVKKIAHTQETVVFVLHRYGLFSWKLFSVHF